MVNARIGTGARCVATWRAVAPVRVNAATARASSWRATPTAAAATAADTPDAADVAKRFVPAIGGSGMDVGAPVSVTTMMRRIVSTAPAGTTLRVELLAERRGSELRADVTAEAETVHVRVWQDGVEAFDRHFLAPRRNDVDLLAEAIEAGRRDTVAIGALRAAAALVNPDSSGSGS